MHRTWSAVLALLAACGAAQEPLGCTHPDCRFISYTPGRHSKDYIFEVEGNNITFTNYGDSVKLDCAGAPVLDSPALPRAESLLFVKTVKLVRCPLPTGALVDSLSALGVLLTCIYEYHCTLILESLPSAPPLSRTHFLGLERLYALQIYALDRARPERDFLAPLSNLLSLFMLSVELPSGSLNHMLNLERLGLGNIALWTLPRDMFAVNRRLKNLDLSQNALDASELEKLAPLVELKFLKLPQNPGLGDLCEPAGYSPFRNKTQLTSLYLFNTTVSRVCRDWRDLTSMRDLDLTHTRIKRHKLLFQNMQYPPSEGIVYINRYPLTAVVTTQEQFEAARDAPPDTARVNLQEWFANVTFLTCDCSMYWTRRALDLQLASLETVGELHCADGRLLRDVPAEQMCAPHELPNDQASHDDQVSHVDQASHDDKAPTTHEDSASTTSAAGVVTTCTHIILMCSMYILLAS